MARVAQQPLGIRLNLGGPGRFTARSVSKRGEKIGYVPTGMCTRTFRQFEDWATSDPARTAFNEEG
jgi:hypothetical protein